MPTKVQLTGGNFQDAAGNVLANGYLKMSLAFDANISGVGLVASGVEITIQLDGSGAVQAAQYVWGVDQMSPVNNYYRVTGYTAAGQPAWGPNNQQVTGNGGTFDVGTWTPNTVINWTPPIQPLTIKTNGTVNGSQILLNLAAGANTSITDNGSGTVTIAVSGITGITLKTNGVNNGSQTTLNLAAGTGIALVDNGTGTVTVTNTLPGGSISAGQSIFTIPSVNGPGWPAGSPAPGILVANANTTFMYTTGRGIQCPATQWKVTLVLQSASWAIGNFNIAKVTRDTGTVISSTPITFGGLASPTLSSGINTSDAIVMTFDPAFDYYFRVYSAVGAILNLYQANGASYPGGIYSPVAGDHTADSTIPAFIGGSNTSGASFLSMVLSA